MRYDKGIFTLLSLVAKCFEVSVKAFLNERHLIFQEVSCHLEIDQQYRDAVECKNYQLGLNKEGLLLIGCHYVVEDSWEEEGKC